ncbi:MAG: tetratricopeptide repeat protein [Candidatus Omnitrophica bacterium]|nr:tetratricopeptide repeat protein [Candidatus Omnitrophota bacterium]
MRRLSLWTMVVLGGVAAAAWALEDSSPSSLPAKVSRLNNLGVTAAQSGDFEIAADYLRQALAMAPRDAHVKENLSSILTDWSLGVDQQGKPQEAVDLLEEAVELQAKNGKAWVRLGDILYFRMSRFSEAIAAWQQAQGKIPEAAWRSVVERIAQAQRDQLIERTFANSESPHFVIRAAPNESFDREALVATLEKAHLRLSEVFGDAPPHLTVLVYSRGDLHRTYYQRDWAVGFYDGRIRLSAEDLDAPYVPDLIMHELTHAFLQELYGRRLPTWVHEGFAQAMERGLLSSPERDRIERRIRERAQWIPLKWLDRHFQQPSSTEDIAHAYVEASVVVEELVKRYGRGRWLAFLEALSKGRTAELAYNEHFAPSTWAKADRGIFD